jgi:hypothetical protein
MRSVPGEIYTFLISWIKPFNEDEMPYVGRRWTNGQVTFEIINVRISELVFDAKVI